jgi:uncharacterized protein with ParB-like and HNH nuclease domain
MTADAMSLTFLANEGIVKIPFFQRGYVWNKINWEDLLEDLLDTKKGHFLGSLILKHLPKQSGKLNELFVIDGQQRLTTLTILIKALYNSFDEEIKENCDTIIKSHLFYKKNATDKNFHVKISHSKIDSGYYTKIIDGSLSDEEYNNIAVEDDDLKVKSSDNKVLQCYKYFTEKLKTLSEDIRTDLFNQLLDTNNKIIVVIDLNENEDEQSIFDTINSAGVRLSGADIIKNALFQKALDVYDSQEDVLEIYKSEWEEVFISDYETIAFWDKQRITGRLTRDNIELLLHSISVIKGFFDPDIHVLSDLAILYKGYISKLDKSSLEAFIKEIAKYARLYKEKILNLDNTTLYSYEDDYTRLFHVLNVCDVSTFHPFILSLFYKYDKNEHRLKEELNKLEKFVIRRMIAKKETKSYNKICKEFILDNNAINEKLLETTGDQVINGLNWIANRNAALLLFWVELKRREENRFYSIKELKYDYSLEHIMPQKWQEHWSEVPVYDQDNNLINEFEKAKNERNARIYSIGNMTLLKSSLNTSLRNYSLDRKIEGEGRRRGIRYYAELDITKADIVDLYDNISKNWNEKCINDRTKALSSEILSIWD